LKLHREPASCHSDLRAFLFFKSLYLITSKADLLTAAYLRLANNGMDAKSLGAISDSQFLGNPFKPL
jgi:hypothetical protein